jgi:hypothetical protein
VSCIRKLRQLIAIAIVAVTLAFAFVATAGVEPAYAQTAPPSAPTPVQVTPSTAGLPGASLFQNMLNWLSQAALWGALASLLIGAAIWGLSQHAGNSYSAGKGRTLALAGVIGALLAGLAPTIVNTLFAAAR